MKHGLVYLLLVAGVVLTGSLPFASHDVGELRPVQTALVRMEADRVILKTDMGDVGAGIGWDAAMADLKANAPGQCFLARLASCCWRKALRTCCRSCLRRWS